MRARQQGKPVVLIDPNYINNSTLNALVDPEQPVHSVEEACARVRALAEKFRPFKVVKRKAGTEQPFSPAKLTKSITQACAAAGTRDTMFEERISGPVIAWARRTGGQQGYVASEEIRAAIFRRLESMETDRTLTPEMRSRARLVIQKWEDKEQSRDPEAAIASAEQRATNAEEEAAEWKRLYKESAKKPQLASPGTGQPTPGPRFQNVDQMVDGIKKRWGTYLFVHDTAIGEARKAKPKLESKELEELHELLNELGAFMHDRACAAADGSPIPTFEERFGTTRYARTESGATKERYRKTAVVEFMGRKYFGLPHVKGKVDGKPVRVHFDEVGQRLLISYIGRHRPTYSHDG
jgi:hypothetical protein